MKKYQVMFVKYGFATVDADNYEDSLTQGKCLYDYEIDWSTDTEIVDANELDNEEEERL